MKHILYTAVALMLLSSCNKNQEEPQTGNYPSDGLIRINTSLAAMQTRAGEPTDYTGTDLSIWLDYDAGDKYTVKNIKWTTADVGATWIPATQMLWKNANSRAMIYAYAPHVAEATEVDNIPFSVQADQSAGLVTSDLVGYVNYNFMPSTDLVGGKINIPFGHKLSKLTLDLTFGDQFGETPTVANVFLSEALPTVSYNSKMGVVSAASGTAAPIKMHAVNATKYDVILAPQTIVAGKQMITVILSGSTTEYTYTVPTGGHTFATGTAYTMKLHVGKDKLEAGEVTVTDWTTGAEIPGGEAVVGVEVDPNTHTLTVITEGTLKAKHITAALAGGTVLAVKGTLNANDVTTLTATSTLTTIDLQGVQYTGGTIPTADWSACTNLTKIIIAPADATDYEIKWSAAIGKLFHLGKMDYNHTALDGQTYICKVISLSTSSVTVVHLKKQTLNNSIGMTRAVAQAAIDTKDARFLKKAEFEQLVLDGTITVAGSENVFCHEDCAGWYMDSKFGYQATSRDPNLTACYFLVFDL